MGLTVNMNCLGAHPSVSLHKKYAKKLKELQKEYYFLFEEDDK